MSDDQDTAVVSVEMVQKTAAIVAAAGDDETALALANALYDAWHTCLGGMKDVSNATTMLALACFLSYALDEMLAQAELTQSRMIVVATTFQIATDMLAEKLVERAKREMH